MSPLWTLLIRLAQSYLTDAGRAALRNFIWLGVSTVLGQIFALGSLYLLYNQLPPAGLGAFLVALTVQGYLVLLSQSGLGCIIVREGALYPERVDLLFSAFLTLSVGTALAGCLTVALLCAAGVWTGEERRLVLLLSAGAVAGALQIVPFFDLRHRQSVAARANVLAELLGLVGLAILASRGELDPIMAAWVFVLKWTLTAFLQLTTYHLRVAPIRWRWHTELARQVFWSALPISVSAPLILVPLTGGILFVQHFHGNAEAALIGLAGQVVGVYLSFAYLANRILLPHINGRYGLTRRFIVTAVFFEGLFLLTLTASAALGSWIVIWWWLEPFYRAALPPLLLLLGSVMTASGLSIVHAYLVRLRRERTMMVLLLGQAALFALLSWMIVPSGASTGAAAASWGVMGASAVVSVALARRAYRSQAANEARLDHG